MPWYTRDASWHNMPGVTKPKKYHRAKDNGLALCDSRIVIDWNSYDIEPIVESKCKRCLSIMEQPTGGM